MRDGTTRDGTSTPLPPSTAVLPWLRVVGDRLVDDGGRAVPLLGVGLGGWMNMENFITGFPATESLQRQALLRVLGREGYERFFARYLTDFFAAPDARFLASLGLNSVRVPFNYRHFEDDARPFELRPEGFRHLDRVIDLCEEAGLYTILDLHAVPGAQNQNWHSDNPTHHAMFWEQRQFQDRVVHLWEALADRYRDRSCVAGYNPLNEPSDPTGECLGPFYDRLERAIRAVDDRHILFLDGNRYSSDFSVFDEPYDNTVYTAHDYALPGMVPEADYPGPVRGEWFDRAAVEQSFLRRTEYMRRTGTPIWIGEFGPQYLGDPERDRFRYDLLGDQLGTYAAHGAGWSLWTYKDVGLQGIVHTRPDAPYLRRIASFLEKKNRLGADSWGGTDRHIRQLLDPVETLFREEFPDFQPYPWGQRPWIHLIVRNILLAEALVDDFARCFDGVSPEEAEQLAASFAFAECSVREPLAAVLRERVTRWPANRP